MNIDFAKARDIFLEAVEKSDPHERNAFLDEACGTDQELRRHADILTEAPDLVVVCPGGPRTANMVKLAVEAGIEVLVVE